MRPASFRLSASARISCQWACSGARSGKSATGAYGRAFTRENSTISTLYGASSTV